MPEITVYYSSVSGNKLIKSNQSRVEFTLQGKKVPYKLVDVAADERARDTMRAASGTAAVPQVFVDGKYKGGFKEFEDAAESNKLNEFFGLSGVF